MVSILNFLVFSPSLEQTQTVLCALHLWECLSVSMGANSILFLLDSRLYNEAFTKAVAWCNHCLQDDHSTSSCPLNQPVMPWFPDVPAWPATGMLPMRSQAQSRSSICRRLLNNMHCLTETGK